MIGLQPTGTLVLVCPLEGIQTHLALCKCRPETTEHAMNCMARLVRVLLGETAISEKKLESGPSLVVLGVKVRVTCSTVCIIVNYRSLY